MTIETEWSITISGAGLRGAGMNLRDSHPGDFCWRGALGQRDLRAGVNTLTIAHTSGPLAPDENPRAVPIAAVDACGTEYSDSAIPLVLTVMPKGSGALTIEVSPAS